MKVEVMLFGILRERARCDALDLELADGATVGDAITELGSLPALSDLLERVPVCLAVNREYASDTTVLGPGDEIALIPPLSGGSAEPPGRQSMPHVRITDEQLSLDPLVRAVGSTHAGAVVVFQGVTRTVSRIHYEAYREMAEQRIQSIARECIVRHGLQAAAVEHRVGSVALGEPSVIVVVSAAHRDAAFAGARETIDRIKAEAPIWKRELLEDGQELWVDGVRPPVGDRGSA